MFRENKALLYENKTMLYNDKTLFYFLGLLLTFKAKFFGLGYQSFL